MTRREDLLHSARFTRIMLGLALGAVGVCVLDVAMAQGPWERVIFCALASVLQIQAFQLWQLLQRTLRDIRRIEERERLGRN